MPSMLEVKFYIFLFIAGSIVIGAIAGFVYAYDKNRRPVSGRHVLLGQVGRAKQDIQAGKLGKVYLFGEYWDAICDETLEKGQAVKVVEVHDKFLKVVPSDLLPEST